MQIPGLNLLHVPSPVVAPTETPAVSDDQRRLIDSSPPILGPDAPELRDTTPTAGRQSPVQDSFIDTVKYDDQKPSQIDIVPAPAILALPDPLDLALADRSSDSSGDEDAEVESTSNDRYCYSTMWH